MFEFEPHFSTFLAMLSSFYAAGVKLVVGGSPVLDLLKTLESKGVHLIICVTCLQYFDLKEKVAVGIQGA